MKKLLALMLAAALALSLVACGGGGGTGDTNTPSGGNGDTTSTDAPSGGEDSALQGETSTQPEMKELGETITTENFEFTLMQAIFGTNLCPDTSSPDYLIVDGDYSTTVTGVDGKKYTRAYVADDDRAYVSIAYTLNYIGKTSLTWTPAISVDYNDGYTFSGAAYSNSTVMYKEDEKWNTSTSIALEPLAPEREFRFVFDVPREVMENTDAPVKINISLDGSQYTYSIR